MKNKLVWIIAAVVAIIALIVVATVLKQVNNSESAEDKDGYETYEVEKESPLKLEGKASPSSVKTYNYNSQIGTYISTQVSDGDSVNQGDPLISYDVNGGKRQDLAIDDAQSSVNDDYNNINQKPYDNQLQKKLAQDESALADAQKQLDQYDQQVNDSVYASFDGKVDIQNSKEVSEGQPILQLVADEPQIKTSVSEYDLDKIKVGDEVDVKISNNGKTGKGEITKISQLPTSYEDKMSESAAGGGEAAAGGDEGEDGGGSVQASNPVESDPSGGSDSESSKYSVVISDINIPIRAGYSTDVKIPLNSIKIPKSVLTKDNKVFVVNDENKVSKRNIKINKVNGEIFVENGLKQGDKLIKNPKKYMNDGEKVEVSS